MGRILALAFTALLVGSFAAVPAANADHGGSSNQLDTDFNATVVMTLANPGQFYSDAEGNRYYQGLVYTGQLTGWPVTGSLRIDANLAFQAGSSTGEIDGSYVISDGTNTFRGDLSETRVQELGNGLAISARMNVEGGTGLFDDARGNARIAGTLPGLGVAAAAFSQGFNPGLNGLPYAYGPLGPAQPQYGAFASGIAPWQVNPTQPTLAISGHLALNESSHASIWHNPNFLSSFPNNQVYDFHSNRDAQRAFRNAIRDFFDVEDNFRPGNGWGDRNHEHTGPPGRSSNDDNNRNRNRGRGNGRGRD